MKKIKEFFVGIFWMIVLFVVFKIGTALGFGALWTFLAVLAIMVVWGLVIALVKKMRPRRST
jgi:hypothetical protein